MTNRPNCSHANIVKHAIAEDRHVLLFGYCIGCNKDVRVNHANYVRTEEEKFGMTVYRMTRLEPSQI